MGEVIFKNVSKRYDKVEAVKGLNLEAHEGECLVILGPSGAGKTSILKMIAGVEDVSDGEIYIDGRLANFLEPRERNTAMVFESYALYPHYTVFNNLAFPLRSPTYKVSETEVKARVNKVAGMLGMTPLLERLPGQLSQGQKQRVGLGRALVRQPSVFLFDEPLSHVDAKIRHSMRMEIKKIQEEISTTTIYVTHDYMEAMALADRVIVLNQGVMQQIGSPRQVFDYPINSFVADLIGDPPINFLDVKTVSQNGAAVFQTIDGRYTIPVPNTFRRNVEQSGKKQYTLGVRPMFVAPYLTQPESSHLEGSVYVFERFETGGVLTVSLGENRLRASTDPNFKVSVDQKVWLKLNLEMIRLFDPETGTAITPAT